LWWRTRGERKLSSEGLKKSDSATLLRNLARATEKRKDTSGAKNGQSSSDYQKLNRPLVKQRNEKEEELPTVLVSPKENTSPPSNLSVISRIHVIKERHKNPPASRSGLVSQMPTLKQRWDLGLGKKQP